MVEMIVISKAGTPLSVKIERKDAYEATVAFNGYFWISRMEQLEFVKELKVLIEKYEI